MASVHSPIRTILKPILFKLLGNKFYKYAQVFGKIKDIKGRLVEEKEMVLLPHFVPAGSTAIDVGANYAYYTERLSKLVGDKGSVYAFEPIPFTFSVLEIIVKRLKLTNAKIFKKGVSNKNEIVDFTVPKVGYGTISAGQAHISDRKNDLEDKNELYNFATEEKVKCEIVALDLFLGNEVGNVSFVKIDIEGAELFAMQGMEQLIKKNTPVMLIEICPPFLHGFGIADKQLSDYIEELGYTTLYFENDKLHTLRKAYWESNFILIHKSQIAKYKNLIHE
jgi:FkbM family methyltransferase